MFMPDNVTRFNLAIIHAGLLRKSFLTGFVNNAAGQDPTVTANAILNQFKVQAFGNQLDSECTFGPVNTLLGQDDDPPIPGMSTIAAGVGARVGGSPPPNVAVLIHKAAFLPGRHARGRWYIPWGADETLIDEVGALNATVISGTNTRMTNLKGGLAGAGVPLAMYYSTGPGVGSLALVDSLTCDAVVATQRRRLRR